MRLPGLFALIVTSLAACGSPKPDAADAAPIPDAAPSHDAAPGHDAPIADAAPGHDAGLVLTVPDDTYLDELTGEQANTLCTWVVDVQGGPHTIDCGNGTQITIDPAEDCLQNPWPHCQVGSLRTCIEAQAVDQCGPAPAACTAFYECASS
jgi:hypothetical protein